MVHDVADLLAGTRRVDGDHHPASGLDSKGRRNPFNAVIREDCTSFAGFYAALLTESKHQVGADSLNLIGKGLPGYGAPILAVRHHKPRAGTPLWQAVEYGSGCDSKVEIGRNVHDYSPRASSFSSRSRIRL